MDITTGLISIDHPEEALAAKTYEELREEHRERRKSQGEPAEGSLITFRGLPEGKDAYNPSGVFTINGEAFQWARVESRDAQDAVSMLFREKEHALFEPVLKLPCCRSKIPLPRGPMVRS